MIKNSIYKNCLVIIFLVFSNNIFSRDFCKEYCPDCCDCCDCCKKGNETEEDEKNISVKSSFKSDVSEDKANIDNNLEEEIDNLNKESNAFKYLKIQEAIDVYNDETNNKILSYNNLRNKIILYKNLVGIEGFNEEDIKKFVDNKEYNNCNYDFEGIMNLFKKSLENNKQLIPTEKFFKYFYHPEYLETQEANIWMIIPKILDISNYHRQNVTTIMWENFTLPTTIFLLIISKSIILILLIFIK